MRMNIDAHDLDEAMLMAYADGELTPADAARVEAVIANDPAAAQAVAAHRALRARVGAAFAGVLEEPVPAALRDAARSSPSGTTSIGALHRARAVRTRWSSREWLAMAASVVFGAALSLLFLLPRQGGPGRLDVVDNHLVARGVLARALDRQLSADSIGPVQLGLSFRAGDGRYCRAFTLRAARPVAGLACRSGDAWQVSTLAQGTAGRTGAMRQASSAWPAAVLADIDARIQGESLDASAERAARARGWR
jgi:anti-sigma factor RsiW